MPAERSPDPDLAVDHLPDAEVDDGLDRAIRDLLSSCFSLERFARQRYNHVLPADRWMIRDGHGLVAHLAAHTFKAGVGGKACAVMGIAEVCVRPDHRGQGLVGKLLAAAEAHHADIPWAVLMGATRVYARYGYAKVPNVVLARLNPEPCGDCLGKCVAAAVWPVEQVVIDCRDF